MTKEIGGYLQMERFQGEEYYPNMIKLNLGRTALLYILKAVGAHTLWVPYFLCESMINACTRAGYNLKYYRVDENMEPILPVEEKVGQYLLLVNYYGRFTQEDILRFSAKYTFLIVDNTHAFYQEPVEGIPTLYSLRKFFGLSDGAYASLGDTKSPIDISLLERDISCERMRHILGRYEKSGSEYYSVMLDNAYTLENETVKTMSLLTENFLRAIPYDEIAKRRQENYQILHNLLGENNAIKWDMPQGPFTYPMYCEKGAELRKMLAQEKIYVPTYWNNVIADNETDTLEWSFARNILPLPIDQRYDEMDMVNLAKIVKRCMKQL